MTTYRSALPLFIAILLNALSAPWAMARHDDTSDSANSASCFSHDVAVQILGSGGPMHGQGRGSSSYLIWVNHKPFAVLDMGGDTPTALVRAGVGASQIDTLLISHIHPDHVSGLPDFLWGEMTANRVLPLLIVGPDGRQGFADTRMFFRKLFGQNGAFADMRGLLLGTEFSIDLKVVETARKKSLEISNRDNLAIFAYPVSHGKAPSLAYRIDGPNFRIVFAGDQNYLDPGFAEFAEDSDLLVVHAIANDQVSKDRLARVVGTPENLGLTARHARAKAVVLGHLMQATSQNKDSSLWSLNDIRSVQAAVARTFGGPVKVASDLECVAVIRRRPGEGDERSPHGATTTRSAEPCRRAASC